jgi:hypothetical protein
MTKRVLDPQPRYVTKTTAVIQGNEEQVHVSEKSGANGLIDLNPTVLVLDFETVLVMAAQVIMVRAQKKQLEAARVAAPANGIVKS